MTNFSPTFEAALEAVRNADVVEVKITRRDGKKVIDTFPRVYNWLDLLEFMNRHDAVAISSVQS